MSDIEIVVFTNDNHLWLLRGFQYLFNKYWGSEQSVTVAGYTDPKRRKISLESNFKFESIDNQNYPVRMWTNGIMKFLRSRDSKLFILFLEDYWLNSPVEISKVEKLYKFMQEFTDRILRIDLTSDRASCGKVKPYFSLGNVELIETPPNSRYQMSFQTAIWNREHLINVLVPFEDPWEAEMNGTKRLAKRPDLKVLGTLNQPVKYKPVYRTNRSSLDLSALSTEDQQHITSEGWV